MHAHIAPLEEPAARPLPITMNPSEEFRIAHFRILTEIGSGGMGRVYKAFDESLEREVAVKVLHSGAARDPAAAERFLREARTAAAINHPHVVQVHFCGQEDDQLYIVMELARGRTVEQILEEDGRIGEATAIQMAIEIAGGLEEAHELGLVHGDIKPANLMVDDQHGVKILDFGLARIIQPRSFAEEPSEGPPSYIWGTPLYLPPERISGTPEDHRGDIFSLGATLYHAISGRPPFDDSNVHRLILQRLQQTPPLLCEIAPEVSRRTSRIIARMMETDLATRYRDYHRLIQDLHEAQSDLAHPAPATLAPEIPAEKRPFSRWGLPAAAILTVAAILVIWHTQFSSPAAPDKPPPMRSMEAPVSAVAKIPTPATPRPQPPDGSAVERTLTDKDVSLTWDRVSLSHVGKRVTVRGTIVQVGKADSGRAHFLNFCPYVKGSKNFYLVIFENDLPKFADGLESLYSGKKVSVTGLVEAHNGRPQIKIVHPAEIKVMKPN